MQFSTMIRHARRGGRRAAWLNASAGAALLLPGLALAQAHPDASSSGGATVQELVVTATKSGESLATSPISASVVTAQVLANSRILTTQDVTVRVPSIVFETAQNRSQIYIRGVGSSFALAGAESAVATYQDGVYLQRQGGATLGLFDTANVQVLRGPQSVLYGRNATAGAIVVNTNDPTHQFGGYVQAGGGNLGFYRAEGVVNVPLNETLAVRVAGATTGLGDWVKNVGAPGRDMGGYRNYYVRGKILWTPTEAIKAVLEVERTSNHDDTYAQHARANAPCTACILAGVPNAPTDFYTISTNDRTGPFLGGRLGDHGGLVEVTNLLGRLEYHADSFDITSLTSRREETNLSRSDNDISTATAFYARVDEVGPTFEQDLYLRTHFSGPLNALLGLFYEDEHNTQTTHFAGFFFQGLQPGQVQDARVRAFSQYADLNLEVLSGLKLTAGLRHSHDRKSLDAVNDAQGAIVAGGLPGYSEEKTYDYITPHAVVSYTDEAGYYYLSYSEGVRTGFFSSPSFTPVDPLKSERLKTWELGAKNTFLNGRLRTEADIFYGKFNNMIVQYDDPASGGIRAQNAASATQKGLEIQATFRATDELTLETGVGLLRAKFDSYPNAAVFAVDPATGMLANSTMNLAGHVVPRAPKVTAFVGATYDRTLPGGWKVTGSANANYVSEYEFYAAAGGPLGLDRQPAYALVNGLVRLTTPNGRYYAELWVKNLTDKKYYLDATTDTFASHYIAELPRTFGGSLGFKF